MKSKNNLILLYHRLESKIWFEKSIKTIGKFFTFVSSQDIIDYFYGKKDLEGCCHITFDDGHKSIYDNAFPVLKKYKLNASLFISPSILDNNQNYWWQKIDFYQQDIVLKETANLLDIDKNEIMKLGINLIEILKELDLKKINELLNILQSIDPQDFHFLNINKKEIIEMSDSGVFTIGSHTYNHPILLNEHIRDVVSEIQQSKIYLENLLGKEVDTFAYPNGIPGLDYAAREIEVCKNTNIKIAYSCEASYLNKSHSNLSVPRLEISNGSKLKTLTKIFFLKYLKSKLMNPKITLGRLNFRKIIC